MLRVTDDLMCDVAWAIITETPEEDIQAICRTMMAGLTGIGHYDAKDATNPIGRVLADERLGYETMTIDEAWDELIEEAVERLIWDIRNIHIVSSLMGDLPSYEWSPDDEAFEDIIDAQMDYDAQTRWDGTFWIKATQMGRPTDTQDDEELLFYSETFMHLVEGFHTNIPEGDECDFCVAMWTFQEEYAEVWTCDCEECQSGVFHDEGDEEVI